MAYHYTRLLSKDSVSVTRTTKCAVDGSQLLDVASCRSI